MGKEKKGKAKGGKKKKAKEPQMTVNEAILAYQINIAEKKLEDVQYDLQAWEEKNRRHEDRNVKLKEEQDLLLQHLLRSARELSRHPDTVDIKTHEDVIECMKEKWQQQRIRAKELTDLKGQIAHTEVQIDELQEEVDTWTHYRDNEVQIHDAHIKVLEQELRDMQITFEEMSAHLHQNLVKNKEEIEKFTDETLAQQKNIASHNAMASLTKFDRQEVLDNDWLKKEVHIHRGQTEKIRERVEDLERTNLEMMSRLFDCNMDDLKVSRHFYMSHLEDADEVENPGIVEKDLARLSPLEFMQSIKPVLPGPRQKSAILRTVEDKVLTVGSKIEFSDDKHALEDSEDINGVHMSFITEENFYEYLHPGPLELKLLNVAGSSMPIYRIKKDTPSQETDLEKLEPDAWPVTQPMLNKLLSAR